MKNCFKDANRPCNDACAAYCAQTRHGVHCLELATNMESCERAKHMSMSNELYAITAKMLSKQMRSFENTVKTLVG